MRAVCVLRGLPRSPLVYQCPASDFQACYFFPILFSLSILFLGQRVDLFKNEYCVLGKNLPFVKLVAQGVVAGLAAAFGRAAC